MGVQIPTRERVILKGDGRPRPSGHVRQSIYLLKASQHEGEHRYRIRMPTGCSRWVGPIHWRYLANTIEPSMCGGDAAFYQITPTTCHIIFRYTQRGQKTPRGSGGVSPIVDKKLEQQQQ